MQLLREIGFWTMITAVFAPGIVVGLCFVFVFVESAFGIGKYGATVMVDLTRPVIRP